MSKKCEAHGMNLDLFCLGHNIAVCARCAQNEHFKCPQFVPIEDAAKYISEYIKLDTHRQQNTEKILLNGEENTFTTYVKAAIESGEDNTFTKYLKSTTARTDDVRTDETSRIETPHTSRDFELEDGTEEYNITIDESTDQIYSTLDTSRSFSADDNLHSKRSPRRNVSHDPSRTTKSTPTIKSDVGQLLEDVQKFSKGLSSRDDVGMTLDDLMRKINRALFEIADNFANTRKQKEAIESQIREIKRRLTNHIDDMVRVLLDSLHSKFRQAESSVSSTVDKLQKSKTEIGRLQNGDTENQNSSPHANTILAIRESDKQVRRMKRSTNALTDNVYAIDMDVQINQDLFAIIDEIKIFGEVTINTRLNPKIGTEYKVLETKRIDQRKTRPAATSTNKQPIRNNSKKTRHLSNTKPSVAPKREVPETRLRLSNVQPLPEIELGQLAVLDEPLPEVIHTNRSGISGIRLLQKKKVKIGHKWTSSVTKCKMLPNGRLIFIDSDNKRLVIHNKDTYVYRNLRVNDPPRDFTVLDGDRVAVTFGSYIEILNILTSRIEKRIRLEFFECNGISYMDGKFYIYGVFEGYLLSRHGIQIMDIYGRIEDRLPITRVQTIHHSIDTWKGRIYYTGYSSINCCMTSGEELWTFTHDRMNRPQSLTVDGYGNVFASYESENKLVVISVDGMSSKEFELRKRDLYYGQDPRPINVYFDDVESALVVCNENKDHSVMYFVKYE